MALRDVDRLRSAARAAARGALGSGACVGVNYPYDRARVASALGLGTPVESSLDAVSDRDFALDLAHACAVTALPILILFMEKLGILRRPLGQRILRYASLDDLAVLHGLPLEPPQRVLVVCRLADIRRTPGQPWVADWLSITIAVSGSPIAAAYAIASWFEPSSSSASPSSTNVRVSG